MTAHITRTAYGQKLAAKERHILALIAHGLTNKAIGDRLGVTEDTIRSYTYRIYTKLGARNRAHAVTIAFVKGHLDLPSTLEEGPR